MTVRRCFGIAVAILGIAPSEFWRMTPRQFADALEVHREQLQREEDGAKRADLRAALVVCKMHNLWRGEGEPMIRPEDVFAWLKPEPQTAEQMAAAFRAFAIEHNARLGIG